MARTDEKKIALIRNTVISCLVMLLFSVPLVTFCLRELTDIDLSHWLSTEEVAFITGDRTQIDLKEHVGFRKFENKDFQSALEASLNNSIPMKAVALIGNATMQRAAIELSNVLFGWECYPAKYGTEMVVWPSQESVLPSVMRVTEENTNAMKAFIDNVNEVADKYPDVRFVFQGLVDTYSTAMNPSYELITGSYDAAWIEDVIGNNLDNRVTYLLEDIETEDQLGDGWFSTEHHWEINESLEAYNALAGVLDLKPSVDEDLYEVIPQWTGSSARTGLFFEYTDSLFDTTRRFDNLSAQVDGYDAERGLREQILEGATPPQDYAMKYNAYHMYYGMPKAEVIWKNEGENNGKNCLFVEQSYGVPIERYIADNYRLTVATDPLNQHVTKTIEDFIVEFEIDDVIIQLGPAYIWRMQANSPVLFE